MANIHNLPLEGDGIAENLYQYLWTKDELDDGPRLCIPDTIVYKYRQPAAWYFTSVDGSIKKKNKANLINVRIEESFLRKRSGSDIVAYYISSNHASREEGTSRCVGGRLRRWQHPQRHRLALSARPGDDDRVPDRGHVP